MHTMSPSSLGMKETIVFQLVMHRKHFLMLHSETLLHFVLMMVSTLGDFFTFSHSIIDIVFAIMNGDRSRSEMYKDRIAQSELLRPPEDLRCRGDGPSLLPAAMHPPDGAGRLL